MTVALLIAGFALLVAELYAVPRNRRALSEGAFSESWRFACRWQLAVGIPLGFASQHVWYTASAPTGPFPVWGIPFPASAVPVRGWDYIVQLSAVSLTLDLVVWMLLPSLALWAWSILWPSQDSMPNKSLERTREG